MKATDTGIKRILKAFVYSYDGFKAAFKSEAAFRQDVCFFIVMTIVALCLDMPGWQQARLIASLIIVLLAELTNTAIETTIDRISDEYHELSKKAKDIGSLLVLLSFVYVALVWGSTIYGWLVYS